MRGVARAVGISTVVVVGYTAVIVLLSIANSELFGVYGLEAIGRLSMPLELPWYIYGKVLPKVGIGLGRAPITYTFLLLAGTLGPNIFLYYIPIRLFLQWREQRTRLP